MIIFTFWWTLPFFCKCFHNNTQTLRLQTCFYRHLVKICLITLLKCYDKRNVKLRFYIIRPKWPWVSDSFNSLMHILWSYHIQSGLANNIIVCIGHNQTCGNRAAPFEKQLSSNSYNTNTPDGWMLNELRCSLVTNAEFLCCSKQWRADWSDQVCEPWTQPCHVVDETYVRITQSSLLHDELQPCVIKSANVMIFFCLFLDLFFGKSNFPFCVCVMSPNKIYGN